MLLVSPWSCIVCKMLQLTARCLVSSPLHTHTGGSWRHACPVPCAARLSPSCYFRAGPPSIQRSCQASASGRLASGLPLAGTLWFLSEAAALADQGSDFSQGGFAKESYYVTLGLFLLSLPGSFAIVLRHTFWLFQAGLLRRHVVNKDPVPCRPMVAD